MFMFLNHDDEEPDDPGEWPEPVHKESMTPEPLTRCLLCGIPQVLCFDSSPMGQCPSCGYTERI